MSVGDDMHKFARLKSRHLRQHAGQRSVLHDIPVVRREHILRALVEYGVEPVSRDIEGHRVCAGVQRHLAEVCVVVDIGHDAPRCGVMLEVKQHSVDLIHLALGVAVLHAELIAVGLADGAGLVRPSVPDMAF